MQEPETENKVLVQFHIDHSLKEQITQSPDYHKGLLAHLARKGFIKEVELFLNQEPELKAS